MVVKIYVEGAGPTDRDRALCRQAFAAFFKSAGLDVGGKRPRTVPCGGRQAAYDAFVTAVASNPGELALLLVDSEKPVTSGHTPWQHLRARDNWTRPAGASDDQAFLMVQVMETWLIADRKALLACFGSQFNEGAFPAWPALEDVPKDKIYAALTKATAHCGKGYSKGWVSFQLLEKSNASVIEKACPHAKRLLDYLRFL